MTASKVTRSPEASRRLATLILTFFLLATPLATASYKIFVLDYALEDVLPDTEYVVDVQMSLDGNGGRARARTFLPENDGHQTITNVVPTSVQEFRFSEESEGGNRVGAWFGSAVPDQTTFSYSFTARLVGHEYQIAPDIEVPDTYPPSLAEHLQPEEAIQVDDPEIVAKLEAIGANDGNVLHRLQAIFDATAALTPRPFSGTTDALTALRLGEASCNGKSRLFVALARAAGIPSRLVGGIILEPGSKRTSHQWVEAYVGGHWIPFDSLNGHFASIPGNYLVLYRGDYGLFRYTSDVNFDYEFSIAETQVPPLRTLETFQSFNVWGLFDRLGLPFSLLRTVLMLPIGALLVVVFRNVVGVPTFGTFLPALIAEGASGTGLFWGLVAICIVMLTVALARLAIQRFGLLHSPTLAILLAVVVLTMLGTSLAAEAVGLMPLTKISYFPIAVMAIASERFYLALVESGPRKAFNHLAGTLLVVFCCYLVMNSLAMQVLVSGFPEVLLWVIAGNVYLGRWVGVRVLEMLRFKGLIDPGLMQPAAPAPPEVVAAAAEADRVWAEQKLPSLDASAPAAGSGDSPEGSGDDRHDATVSPPKERTDVDLVRNFAQIVRNRARLKDVVGINRRNVELVYAHNRRDDYPLVDDRIVCKKLMEAGGVPVANTVVVCEGLFAIPRTMDTLRTREQFVIKPANGSGGDGIMVLGERTETGWLSAGGRPVTEDEITQHIANIVFGAFSKQLDDYAFVEERIFPHPLFAEFFNGGLSDIRLIFLGDECVMSMVRIPTKTSGGRANLHQGGIGVAVDIATGRTTRAVFKGQAVEIHPETGGLLVGRQLPHWERTMEVGRRAAACVPLGYIGVDIVVDKDRGPMVLEMNARPGLEIQNINARPLGPVVDEVLR